MQDPPPGIQHVHGEVHRRAHTTLTRDCRHRHIGARFGFFTKHPTFLLDGCQTHDQPTMAA
eukprot:5575269-Pyramimonas_sp.AAC.1